MHSARQCLHWRALCGQPHDQKIKLLDGHDAYKKTALLQGKSETQWQDERDNLIRLANDDDDAIIGFYQSCQVRELKP